jgi:transposase
LRIRLVDQVENGRSARSAARLLKVSESSGIKWVQRWRRQGNVAPSKKRGHRRSVLEPVADWLMHLVRQEKDLTLEEVRARLKERGIRASVSMIWYFLDRHGISFKKNRVRQRTGPPGRRRGAHVMARKSAQVRP